MKVILNTLCALLVVGISGVVFGYLLSLASKFFAVKIDEKVAKCREVLPGANCGGCGYSGCAAYAEAVANGAPLNCCAAGGQSVADQLAAITGRSADKVSENKAFVYCAGGGSGKLRYEFFGMESCIPACRVDGGPHICSFACLGLGSCVKVCQFHAISIVNGVAKVDQSLCTGCGSCVAECPKGIIGLVPADQNVAVPCRSHMKGADTMKACDLGCIGCKKCEKTCEQGAITVADALATIDYAKCISCGKCFEVCPRHLITNIHGSPFVTTDSPFADMDIPQPVIPAAPAPAPKAPKVTKDKKPAVKPMPVPGPVPENAPPVITKPNIPSDATFPPVPDSPIGPRNPYNAPVPKAVVDEIISRISNAPVPKAVTDEIINHISPDGNDATRPTEKTAAPSPDDVTATVKETISAIADAPHVEAPATRSTPADDNASPAAAETVPQVAPAAPQSPFPTDPKDDLDEAFASLVEQKTGDSESK